MIHRIVIELTDELGGYEEELEHLERVYGAEELPQGEWIIIEHENQYLMGIYQCNKCGYKYTCPDEFARNFCPNCGAKMT